MILSKKPVSFSLVVVHRECYGTVIDRHKKGAEMLLFCDLCFLCLMLFVIFFVYCNMITHLLAQMINLVGKISDDERRKYPPMREKVSEGG